MKPSFAIAAALFTLVAARPALASVSYPGELMKQLGVSALPVPAPYCTVCHASDVGGVGTITTPFGRALLRAGALQSNLPSLDAALDDLDAMGTDSDQDGVSDLDELRQNLSPNEGEARPGAEPLEQIPLPRTGCAVRTAVDLDPSASLVSTLSAVLLLLVARARRSSG